MATAKDKAQKAKAKKPKRKSIPKSPPEQKLGDTPVAPWDMPTPKEKKQARPVRRVLKEAVAKVDSQEKADKVISKLEEKAADKTAAEVEKSQSTPSSPAEAAQQVKEAVEAAPQSKKTEKALEATAKVLTTEHTR